MFGQVKKMLLLRQPKTQVSKLGDTDALTNDDKVDNELVDVVAVVVVWLTKEDEDTGIAAADVWPSKEDVAAWTAEDEVSKLGDTDTLTNDDKVDNELVDVVAVVVVWLTKEDEDTVCCHNHCTMLSAGILQCAAITITLCWVQGYYSVLP